MSKPIQPTPTLRGEDARRFIREMIKEKNNPDPKRLEIIRRAKNTKFEIVG